MCNLSKPIIVSIRREKKLCVPCFPQLLPLEDSGWFFVVVVVVVNIGPGKLLTDAQRAVIKS